jgi:isoquinoline 1-oxidoreductase beta subunit
MKENKEAKSGTLSRRKFLATTGGFTFAITAHAVASSYISILEYGKKQPKLADNQITAWVHLDHDGTVTIYNPATEMGQGSMTALPAIVAEEMDADWSKVRVKHAPIEPEIYGHSWGRSRRGGGNMTTAGSISVMGHYFNLRHAGAQARYILLFSASKKWEIPLEELETEPGMVVHKSSGKKISYGDLLPDIQVPGNLPEIPESNWKKHSDFKIIGNNSLPRLDLPSKSNGTALYSIDIRLPGMVYGVISRSPVNGAKPTLLNETEIRSKAGILDVVVLEHGIGLISSTLERALEVKEQLRIQWGKGAKAEGFNSEEALFNYVKIAADENQKGNSHTNKGNTDEAMKTANKIYEADYFNDFCYHAQMEPLNAVVSISESGASAEVWVGSQAFDGARNAAASALGLDRTNVKIHPMLLGGGFGRRSSTDFVVEACALAKVAKRPLKLIWTREDDIHFGMFRPMSLQRFQAGMDAGGNLHFWKHCIVGQGRNLIASGALVSHYNIPHVKIDIKEQDHGVRTTYWRAVGHPANNFAIESFIDEIAAGQKTNPLALRQKLMVNSPKALRVLNKVAELSDWSSPSKTGRAKGMAFCERSNSLIAGVVEISLNRSNGKIKVHNVWVAIDAGMVVQPENATAQIEGGVIMGLSSVLNESITFRHGAVEQSNYDDYPILRMHEAPEAIQVYFVPSEAPPTGIGEAGNPWLGAAVGNAFAALTGKRLRHMPFTTKKVFDILKS